ncbi:MAG: hypothetical protein A4E49_01881 [Methanosaeta sp. PtaU1.Bin112]|nr:MAG: hypothetical protein A4E49_01881 [Methanosaeta sp. PtaU1.Bin112]
MIKVIPENHMHRQPPSQCFSSAPGGTGIMARAYLEHSIQDARVDLSGEYRVFSKRMPFVEIDSDGKADNVGNAPYLDYRPAPLKNGMPLSPGL